ncbi:uncharacterized protein F4812DRAFT_463662 [Daldinia caldariorum]|uniref:uncharacterized protein n=1 Tax=Daldinia caldariorum TaxID=326644 RepID=UPI002008901D|nr:uncharacterized protein F4812DRAFT_463662 [Daldinia caldariorum]KAI1463565.1 hypothetical protein F4812DRAFT_463662 [Daldinia caldariorum]
MSQDQAYVPYLPTISFGKTTKAVLYEQSRWLWVNNQLVDDMKIQQPHFLWLLERANIPAAVVGDLFHKNRRHFFGVDDFGGAPGEDPTSMYICMRTPSSRSESAIPTTFSLLLGISMQTNSATCIIITSDIDKANIIIGALQRDYHLISAYPLYALKIFCEELSRTIYSNRAHDVFEAIHSFNRVRQGLVTIEYDLKFEVDVLRFTQDTIAKYQDMQHMPQCPGASWRAMRGRITNLKDAARFRLWRLEGVEKSTTHNVEILNSYNSRNNSKLHLNIAETTRDDSISLRRIAVVTMVFLPITVVATISGSNAIDFAKREIGGGVTAWKYWWVFLLVAITLTLAVSGHFLYQEISRVYQGLVGREPIDIELEQGSDNEQSTNSRENKKVYRSVWSHWNLIRQVVGRDARPVKST